MAPTGTTASTASELVPALASTAGMVNTPMPITSPVAEVRPMLRSAGPGGGTLRPGRLTVLARVWTQWCQP
jgi:hypothetical protein